ncbi:hypothetical protein C471_09460 [Halorubrum saccharovorum DSM 1137]|uniref:Uncharacterized protein n=1 Tax=Halorubrum saccharovorum DSM 1137 TaxID=1227484 RepID=M0DVP0_9EURY|nr:hypothetical protein C471_09460 [Halorubrum saccharovorum DSM 1137]
MSDQHDGEDTDAHEVTRREYLASGAGISATATLPIGFAAGAFTSDSLSPLARQFVSAQAPGLATFEHSIRRYATDPSWTLRASTDDDYAALTEWAGDDKDVTLVREYQHTKGDGGTVTIGAPIATVAGGYLTNGVADEPWVAAADLNVVTSLVAPQNIPVDAREFEQLAGVESIILSTLQGQESFDATEFQASDDTSESALAFDAETTTLEQGRAIANDTSADGTNALLAVVDTGLTYDSDIYGRTVTVDGTETTESRVHEESTDFVTAGDPWRASKSSMTRPDTGRG